MLISLHKMMYLLYSSRLFHGCLLFDSWLALLLVNILLKDKSVLGHMEFASAFLHLLLRFSPGTTLGLRSCCSNRISGGFDHGTQTVLIFQYSVLLAGLFIRAQ